jgi:branched-subunit amino acid ABC-type transport system permease component
MSRSGALKEEISLLKLMIGALLAVGASFLAWLAQQYATADGRLVWAAVLATLVVIALAGWLTRLTYRRIRQLEDV